MYVEAQSILNSQTKNKTGDFKSFVKAPVSRARYAVRIKVDRKISGIKEKTPK